MEKATHTQFFIGDIPASKFSKPKFLSLISCCHGYQDSLHLWGGQKEKDLLSTLWLFETRSEAVKRLAWNSLCTTGWTQIHSYPLSQPLEYWESQAIAIMSCFACGTFQRIRWHTSENVSLASTECLPRTGVHRGLTHWKWSYIMLKHTEASPWRMALVEMWVEWKKSQLHWAVCRKTRKLALIFLPAWGNFRERLELCLHFAAHLQRMLAY